MNRENLDEARRSRGSPRWVSRYPGGVPGLRGARSGPLGRAARKDLGRARAGPSVATGLRMKLKLSTLLRITCLLGSAAEPR